MEGEPTFRRRRSVKSVGSLDLTKRFMILTGTLLIATALAAQLFYAFHERSLLEKRLLEKATFIKQFYALQIANALTSKDDVTLLYTINHLEEDPEIFAVVVVDHRGVLRYHRDANKMDLPTDDKDIIATLKSGQPSMGNSQNAGGKVLTLLTPLKIQGQGYTLGVVRIDMTYRQIDEQTSSSRARFWFVILGALATCASFVAVCVNRWVLHPIHYIHTTIQKINPALPEPNFLAAPGEFENLTTSLNEILFRIKSEMQSDQMTLTMRGEKEKAWISQLVLALLPGARIIVADKDNRVLSDSAGNTPAQGAGRSHLLDLITDANFANLVTDAFQREGEAMRGTVTFQEKSYKATILSVPAHQSVTVKTLIALLPN